MKCDSLQNKVDGDRKWAGRNFPKNLHRRLATVYLLGWVEASPPAEEL